MNRLHPGDVRQHDGRTSILFIDPEMHEEYRPSLRALFEVVTADSEEQGLRALRCSRPTLVITELALPRGDGVSVCRQAKALPLAPPSVLAVTAAVERVADALIAQCDGILLKPFPPSLLFNRINRLLRQRGEAACPDPRPQAVFSGTNLLMNDRCCSSCGRRGAVAFDAAERGRHWLACLACRHVWLGELPRHQLLNGKTSR